MRRHCEYYLMGGYCNDEEKEEEGNKKRIKRELKRKKKECVKKNQPENVEWFNEFVGCTGSYVMIII